MTQSAFIEVVAVKKVKRVRVAKPYGYDKSRVRRAAVKSTPEFKMAKPVKPFKGDEWFKSIGATGKSWGAINL